MAISSKQEIPTPVFGLARNDIWGAGPKSGNRPRYSVVRPGQELIETGQLWDAAYTPTAQRVHIPQLAVFTGIRMCTMSAAAHV